MRAEKCRRCVLWRRPFQHEATFVNRPHGARCASQLLNRAVNCSCAKCQCNEWCIPAAADAVLRKSRQKGKLDATFEFYCNCAVGWPWLVWECQPLSKVITGDLNFGA